jgi:hypothetical protein
MSDPTPDIEETQPTMPGDTSPTLVAEEAPEQALPPRKRTPWGRLLVLGWLILIVVAAIGAYGGFQQGRQDWRGTQAALDAEEIKHQYQLGLDNLAAGECARAQVHLDWVIERDPNNAGAIEALAQAITCQNATATPTPVTPTPTPTITPTPDLRGVEEQFAQAEAQMYATDWDGAITTLFSVRKLDPEYRAVDVDSMLYVAFRNRGVDKILNLALLEGGLYDLSQSELFGPLDAEAQSYRNFARLYLIGATFYSVQDWAQAAFYLGQVAPFLPNLRDGSSGFAMDWYLESLENYINQLVEAKDWCAAAEQVGVYKQFVDDPGLDNQQDRYQERCDNAGDEN